MKKIINNILHRFKEDSLAKRNEAVSRTLEYKGVEEIKSCLVFWIADENQNAWLRKLTQSLKDAKIDKLCFVPNGIEMLETDDVVTMRNEDLGFGGKIQNDRLLAVLQQKYDLLIDLTTESGALVNYVLLNSQAFCIAGMKKEGASADIMVDGVSGQIEFIDKLTGVLAEINKY